MTHHTTHHDREWAVFIAVVAVATVTAPATLALIAWAVWLVL